MIEFVLAFTQSLHAELADTGVQVQAVLPNATATGFWDAAGSPLDNPDGVMSAEHLVDAALIDFDRHVVVSIPPLHDDTDWKPYESARETLKGGFGESTPAPRYALA